MNPSTRQTLHALAFLFLLLTGIALPLLLPGAAPWPGDLGDCTRHLLDYQRTHPDDAWNPHLLAGRPGVVDGTFYSRGYPVYACYRIFPSPAVFARGAWLHLLWAGGGLFVLARVCGRSRLAALCAALAFAGSTFFTARLFAGQFPHVAAAAWAPWVIAAWHRLLTRRRTTDAVGLALAAAGHCLAGYPQFLFITACALPLFIRVPAPRTLPRLVVLLLMALALFAALTVTDLLPLQHLLQVSQRSTMTLAQAATGSLDPQELLQCWSPFRYRHPASPLPQPGLARGWETAAFVGLTPWLLLLFGAGALRRPLPRRWLGLGVLALLLALGTYTPLYGLAFHWLPLFDLVRVPSRFLLLFVLALAMLAAFAFDRCRARLPRRARRFLLLLPLLLTLELAHTSWQLLGQPFPARLEHPYWQTDNGAAALLQAQPRPGRVMTLEPVTLFNTALPLGLENCGGYLGVVPRRYLELVSAFAGHQVNGTPLRFRTAPATLLDLLDVQHVVTAADADTPAAGLQAVHRDHTVAVWRHGPPGRAWLVHELQHCADDRALLAQLTAPGFDPSSAALTADASAPPAFRTTRGSDSLTLAYTASGTYRVHITLDTTAVLVLSEHRGMGWEIAARSAAGEQLLPLFAVNHAFVGCRLPAGAHDLSVRYRAPWPLAQRLGLAVFCLLLAILLYASARRLRA